MGNLFFQIFIYVDVFIMGGLSVIAARYGYAHYRPHKHEPEVDKPHIPQSEKDRMLRASELQYQNVLDHSVNKLQTDLDSSAEQINGMIKRFAGEIVGEELEKYRKNLAELHKQAEDDVSGIKQAVAGHQAEIEAKYQQELAKEKQFLVAQIDTKLGDAVASFLLETLQHNVDLGEQGDYLLQVLEEHKAEFKQGVEDDSQTPK